MDCHLEAWLNSSSPRGPMKSQYIELDHRPAAREGVADARADDGSLGDGAVEEPVIGQGLGEAAIDGEGAAPVAVLLAQAAIVGSIEKRCSIASKRPSRYW